LIIQSLAYYLALIYLALKIGKIFPIENCFYIVFFLAFEHTIFQYHSSFWTESFYLTLQILILGLLLNNSHKIIDNLFIGILVGILFLQRSVGIFYIIPIIIYFIFSYRSKSVKPIIASVAGYALIVSLIGIYNYKKIDVFYFYPVGGKQDIYLNLSIPSLSEKKKISETEINKKEVQKAYKWLKDNNIKLEDRLDLDKIFNILFFNNFIKNEKDKIKLYDYMNKRQYKIIFENPLIATKLAIAKVIHFVVLDPTHNYYYNEHRGQNKIPVFIKSKTHKNWIPYRIIYTLLIYFVCFFGLIYFFKQKSYQLLLLLVLSILYYTILFGWSGMTRLYVPSLIYLSFFFGNGLVLLINFIKKNEK
jgi:4-amino-4-deoxy-L-arabinose transferase-like glycosyltransferase